MKRPYHKKKYPKQVIVPVMVEYMTPDLKQKIINFIYNEVYIPATETVIKQYFGMGSPRLYMILGDEEVSEWVRGMIDPIIERKRKEVRLAAHDMFKDFDLRGLIDGGTTDNSGAD